MPTERQKDYARGYNRGGARAYDRIKNIIDIARALKRMIAGPNIARERGCGNCMRWMRGRTEGIRVSDAVAATCVWGQCTAKFERKIEPAMWPDRGGPIITTENFCCSGWLPK